MPLNDPVPEPVPPEATVPLGPIECSFASARAAIRLARHVLANWLELQPGVDVDAIDDLLVVCSELVTNAVDHSAASVTDTPTEPVVTLRAAVDGDAIRFEVENAGDGFPWPTSRVIADVPPTDERGRGLFIVEALTDELDVRASGGRTIVRGCKLGVLRQAPAPDDGQLSARFRAPSHRSEPDRQGARP